MHSQQGRRLDKIQDKLRNQLAQMQVLAITNVLNKLPAQDKAIFLRSMGHLAAIPAEQKSDAVQLSQHLTQVEIDLMNRVHALLLEKPYTVAQEAILTLQVALQACERVRA
jgi:hypothetical protein